MKSAMKSALLVLLVFALYVLHQDFWFWRTAQPLLFGFIPVGLSYHAGFTLVTSFVLWLLIRHAWPAHLEAEIEHDDQTQDSGSQSAAREGQPS